jgi:mRNA interferase YafQ
MPSPKTESKRAKLPRRSDFAKTFEKDWRRLTHSGRYNMNQLKEAMGLLVVNAGPLPPQWKDHPLAGSWADHRERHIGDDFFLIYQLRGGSKREEVYFVRAGTHAELFDE